MPSRVATFVACCALAACAPADDVSLQRSPVESIAPTTSTTESTTTTTTEPARPSPPPLAASAAELAGRVEAAERLVRDPGTPNPEAARAAFELQVLYRQLTRSPDWHDAVRAQVSPELVFTVDRNLEARAEFRGMHRTLSDTLPAWEIVDPIPIDDLLTHYQEGEATFGVPWEILAAVNLVETGMGRIRGTSVAGAQGPMQFIPSTWAAFGEGDINDPRDAILGAARYLAHNGGGSGDIDNALFRYNNHQNYVRGVKAYAAVIADDPASFRGFYHWQIVYLSVEGELWLPTGYRAEDRIPVVDYVAANPEHLITAQTD